jgi:hypothetical protein
MSVERPLEDDDSIFGEKPLGSAAGWPLLKREKWRTPAFGIY